MAPTSNLDIDSAWPSAVEGVFQVDTASPTPLHVQIERQVRLAVANATLPSGTRLPSVREAARRLNVSVNTIGRAYAALSREGILQTRAGGGSVIAPHEGLDLPALKRDRQDRARLLARQMVVRALALGLESTEIIQSVARELAERGRPASDAVTLEPLGADEAPLLSSRNRLRGTISSLRLGDVLAEVTLTLDSGNSVVAAITRQSVDRLGLHVGASISAYVKASEVVLGR